MAQANQTLLRPQRRALLLGALALSVLPLPLMADVKRVAVQVWKDPSCGCCKDWIAHLEKNGFAVTIAEDAGGAARAKLGVPQAFASCHTALIQGYLVEGHVPAKDIQRLLKENPKALGLAVPGMPIGSPGMDGPAYGNRQDRYQVLLIQKNGTSQIFNTYS